MRPWITTARLLPFFAISLTGCQSPHMQTRVVTLPPPAVPSTLLLASEGPYRPPAGATQRDAALVIEDFLEALASCNADKAAIASILKAYENGAVQRRD